MLRICNECAKKDYEYCMPDIKRQFGDTIDCPGFKEKPVHIWINVYEITPGKYTIGTTLHSSEEKALKLSQNAVVKAHKIKIKG